MTELRGVIPITATPFDAEGRVDEDSIVTQVGVERAGILETRRGI
jgi:dihydrodipicolinate synthase/N-acetylneuraminate lyase